MAKDVALDGGFEDFENQKKTLKKVKKDKSPQHAFTLRHDVSTKVLLDRILRLKELTTPNAKSLSQGAVVREALELLAEQMNYAKLEKKYSEFLAHINEDFILKK